MMGKIWLLLQVVLSSNNFTINPTHALRCDIDASLSPTCENERNIIFTRPNQPVKSPFASFYFISIKVKEPPVEVGIISERNDHL